MVISNQAIWVLESTSERWTRRLFGRWRRNGRISEERGTLLPASLEIFAADGSPAKAPATMALNQGAAEEKIEPDDLADGDSAPSPLSAAERRARAVAVSALMRIRDGRFDLARNLFAEAAALDAALDLTAVPGFWNLPRGAQQAAVEGYEQAGRTRDAELLAANLRYQFRPKLVRRQPLVEVPLPNQ
jgi:hypothetical protein